MKTTIKVDKDFIQHTIGNSYLESLIGIKKKHWAGFADWEIYDFSEHDKNVFDKVYTACVGEHSNYFSGYYDIDYYETEFGTLFVMTVTAGDYCGGTDETVWKGWL